MTQCKVRAAGSSWDSGKGQALHVTPNCMLMCPAASSVEGHGKQASCVELGLKRQLSPETMHAAVSE